MLAFDAQWGPGWGLFPGKAVTRFEASVRTAQFMKTPQGETFLMGFVPRLRFTAIPLARYNLGNVQNMVEQGFLFALGGCYSPYYNPEGLVLLLCGDFGGGTLTADPSPLPDETAPPSVGSGGVPVNTMGVTKIAATIDAEYNFWSVFHFAARVGFESFLTGRVDLFDSTAPGAQPVYRTGVAQVIATAGIGVHF
jgi:hypothetical protein